MHAHTSLQSLTGVRKLGNFHLLCKGSAWDDKSQLTTPLYNGPPVTEQAALKKSMSSATDSKKALNCVFMSSESMKNIKRVYYS